MNRSMQIAGLAFVLLAGLQGSASSSRLAPKALTRAFLCIHHYEGSWTDGGAPYYGGLQIDADFERTYGAEFVQLWGHANNWPPSVQLAVAMRAYVHRGFGPWPKTRKMCGL